MIRFLNAYFPLRTVFLGISEVCLLTLAFVGAAVACLGANDAAVMLRYEQGFLRIAVIAAALIACMYYCDLYESSILRNRREILTRLIQVMGVSCILLAILYYFYPPLELARGILLIGFSLGAVMLFFWRRLFLMVNALPQFAERGLIVGDSLLADVLATELRTRPELGIRIVGQLQGFETSEIRSEGGPDQQDAERLLISAKLYNPDRIIVAFSERRLKLPVDALLELKSSGVQIQEAATLYEAVTGKVHIETLRAGQLLFSSGFNVSPTRLLYKRIASIILSSTALVLMFPLMLLAALAIRLDSPGPVIFRQKRVGRGGALFTVYKFRTMFDRADEANNHRPAEVSDVRVTRVGRWLRRTRIDELPQLINILCGDMHFVGPRPFVINQEQECVAQIPFYRHRWDVKPGATGWAQVNRGYNVTLDDNKEKLAYDLFYIKNISAGLDILIVFQTLKILLLGRGSR